ncbi:MAG TPA: Crp/Fnr family transcriptional regulator [Chitinophagales bacterium]|nr:Crp/Fnr family transcriptional regulator [Chitinophagales bacterium]
MEMIHEDILLTLGAVYKRVKKGEYIFREGAKCYYYYQLVQGKISWLNLDEDGKIFIQSIIEPGESFGELPLFDGEPYATSAIAETDCIILQLPKSAFQLLLKENTDILFSFNKLLTQRMRYKFLLLKDVAYHTPEQRILTLLHHFKQKEARHNGHADFKIDFTRQQLAEMSGLRVETVIRVIKNLSKKGQLYIHRGKVFMLNNENSI